MEEIVPLEVGVEDPLDVTATNQRVASHHQSAFASSGLHIRLELALYTNNIKIEFKNAEHS